MAVASLSAWQAPNVLEDHQLPAVRVWAAAIALTLTMLVTLLLKASHPPAGATTLLAALGSLKTQNDAINAIMGVVVIAIFGEIFRRARLKGSAPRSA